MDNVINCEDEDGTLVICDENRAVEIRSDEDYFCPVDYMPECSLYYPEEQRFYYVENQYADVGYTIEFKYYQKYTLQEQIELGKIMTGEIVKGDEDGE